MKALCVGLANADILVKPVDNLTFTSDVMYVDQFELSNGGDAMSACSVIGKMGMPCALYTFVGDKQCLFSNFLLDRMKENGIDSSLVKRVSGDSCGQVIALVSSTGDRVFLYKQGALTKLCLEPVVLDRLDEFSVIYVAGTFQMPKFDGVGTLELFSEAQKKGICTIMDTAWDSSGKWLNTISESLKYTDIFLPSIVEASAMTNKEDPADITDVLLEYGPKNIVLKLGDNGCFLRNEESAKFIPPFPVNVVDTTGAGDCFGGGMVTGIMKGFPLEICCRLANATGALGCTAIGATSGIINYQQVLNFMKSNRYVLE